MHGDHGRVDGPNMAYQVYTDMHSYICARTCTYIYVHMHLWHTGMHMHAQMCKSVWCVRVFLLSRACLCIYVHVCVYARRIKEGTEAIHRARLQLCHMGGLYKVAPKTSLLSKLYNPYDSMNDTFTML